jgi:steroid delta-isomerase-like uncharacterized protein
VIAYNEKNWEAAKKALASDAVYDEVATHRTLRGHDEILRAWKGWAATFPDSKGTFESTTASGNTVTLELRWRGTHQGALQTSAGTIEPTRQAIDIRACQVVEVADGRVRSMRHYFDMATMLQQLGVAR